MMSEDVSWLSQGGIENDAARVTWGAPILVKFSEPLDESVFERWVASFRRKNNRFRLWGNPIDLGPGKAHVYAVDVQLWQPVDLEITREHIYALLPPEPCEDLVRRLVANIQRFIAPRSETYMGDRRYGDPIGQVPLSSVRGKPAGG